MSDPRPILYSFSFSHHGRYSSFHRLLAYSQDCRILDAGFPLRRYLPSLVSRRLESRWQRLSEYRLRPVFSREERQCVHFLYPENSVFRTPEWKSRHGLVLSCHQPVSYLRGMSRSSHGGFFKALEVADRVVVLSRHFANGYESLCEPQRIMTIPHGVDVHFFQPGTVMIESPMVLTVGNWLRDYDFWLEVVQRMASSRELRFTVVALPHVVAKVRAQAEAVLGERVRFLSDLSDSSLRELYQQATVLFLPLKDAGANNALLEAMASGTPAFVTDLPACREYADDCAVYFSAEASEECAEKLEALVQDSGRLKEMSRKSRDRAINLFAWEKISARYSMTYSAVLRGDSADQTPCLTTS